MKKPVHWLLVGTATTLFCAPAMAQTKPADPAPTDQSQPATPPAQPAEAAPDDDQSADVVVTADRREQSLQNYAGTAAVLSPDALLRVGIANIENLNDVLPGLRVQNFGGAINVALRGIGTNQNTELGDPNVATHFDDVYVPRVQGLANAYFDLKSVEVNFGPQGTLRGRNASAGSLNFISWAPQLGKFSGVVEGGVGNFDQRSIRGVVNIPFGDKAALRISGSYDRHGSYYRNVGLFPDVAAPYADENRGVRAQLLIEPTDQLSILIGGDYNFQNSTGFNGSNFSIFLGRQAAPGGFANAVNAVSNPRDILTGPLGEQYFTEHGGIRGKITYKTDGLFNVQYVGSHRDLRFGSDGAGPSGVAFPNFQQILYTGQEAIRTGDAIRSIDNFSRGISRNSSLSDYHEVRFFNDTEPFKYSAGGNYFNEQQSTFSSGVADFNSFFQGQEFNTQTKSEVYAFYGDGTYSINSKLRVTGGIRYTNDTKSRTGVISRHFFGGGAANFDCCGFFRIGTEGFEFNTNRTLFNPDQNGDGNITTGEQLAFYLNGVRRFGARDTIPIAFANAIQGITTNPANISNPNFGFAPGGGCITVGNFVCQANGNFTYNFLANTINNQAARINSSFIDWRVRLEFDLAPENLVYGLVSRGHKAASFNDNLGSLGPAPFFRPEQVTLFEIGTKNEFQVFGRRATLNLSAFYNDYRDQQLTALLGVASIVAQLRSNPADPNSPLINVAGPQNVPNNFNQNQVVSFTYNAANSETYGIQGSGSIILPGKFKFGADFLWLEGRVKSAEPVQDFRFQADVATAGDSRARPISGRRLPYTPRFQLNASLAQVIPVGPKGGALDWLVSVSWRSSSFATIFNSIDYAFVNQERFADGPNAGQIRVTSPRESLNDRIPSYYLVNVAAGYTIGAVRIEAYVNNLTDNTVAAGLLVSQFSNTRFFTNPRLIGGRIRVSF
ncbi:MAG: TonB-dependent receptor [Sphingomonas sp.]|uniref:TonB-dependent receptor n=1 Tax=Sphingomonas sp. TaxID=28214 RepID=UPI0025FF7975|nr:TonB-dependent receptor [Sphingomonas sp.]MBY0285314.1 TonB-dependent receptor [Sphingomonas sp.]